MCDYSLHLVASRPAKLGEKLISTKFPSSTTHGFASLEERNPGGSRDRFTAFN
jgi:hypothetical protein